jgi:hypothetical protein
MAGPSIERLAIARRVVHLNANARRDCPISMRDRQFNVGKFTPDPQLITFGPANCPKRKELAGRRLYYRHRLGRNQFRLRHCRRCRTAQHLSGASAQHRRCRDDRRRHLGHYVRAEIRQALNVRDDHGRPFGAFRQCRRAGLKQRPGLLDIVGNGPDGGSGRGPDRFVVHFSDLRLQSREHPPSFRICRDDGALTVQRCPCSDFRKVERSIVGVQRGAACGVLCGDNGLLGVGEPNRQSINVRFRGVVVAGQAFDGWLFKKIAICVSSSPCSLALEMGTAARKARYQKTGKNRRVDATRARRRCKEIGACHRIAVGWCVQQCTGVWAGSGSPPGAGPIADKSTGILVVEGNRDMRQLDDKA